MSETAAFSKEDLDCLNHFEGIFVDERQVLTTGRSGSYVAVVKAQFASNPNKDKLYIVKVAPHQLIDSEYEAHSSAQSLFGKQVPQVVSRSEIINNRRAILVDVAHDNLLDAETLANVIKEQPLDFAPQQIRQLVTQILSWQQTMQSDNIQLSANNTTTSAVSAMSAPEMLRFALDGNRNDRVDGPESVGNRLSKALNLREEDPRIDIGRAVLPNPLAYLKNANLWHSEKAVVRNMRWDFPTGPSHRDLHADNIICLVQEEPIHPIIIDWATFEPNNLALFDLAYLEFDILRRRMSFARQDRGAWHSVLEEITKDIELKPITENSPSRIRGARAQQAYSLLVPLRQQVGPYCQPSPYLPIAWWVACVAAGLNWARKVPVDQHRPKVDRAAGLMYSAYALNKLLTVLKVEAGRYSGLATQLDWYGYEEEEVS